MDIYLILLEQDITDMSKSINLKFIKEFIGHSDIKTTMRYIRPIDRSKEVFD